MNLREAQYGQVMISTDGIRRRNSRLASKSALLLASASLVAAAVVPPAARAQDETAAKPAVAAEQVSEEAMKDYIKEHFDITETTGAVEPKANRSAQWRKTESPMAKLEPGKMRSDREPVPAGFTKDDADRAEIMEAAVSQRSSAAAARLATAGCEVFWPSPNTVCGAILDKYKLLGGPNSYLSFPRSNELVTPDGAGRRTEFINGQIYWHPETGANSVTTHFAIEWGRLGWELSPLGYPIGEEDGVFGQVARTQPFQHGDLYGSAMGLAAIYGSIRDKWVSLGGVNSELGLPVISEQSTPDGIGRFSVFERGLIYWSPGSGAQPITGTMLAQWLVDETLFAEIGYPVGPMYGDDANGWTQEFQEGRLYGATARPPWAACPAKGSNDKVIKSWWVSEGPVAGYKIDLKCGTTAAGFRHIVKNHRGNWQNKARGPVTYTSWMDLADMGITKSLTDPKSYPHNTQANTSRYTADLFFYNRRTGQLVEKMNAHTAVSVNNKLVITAFPQTQ